MEFLRQELHRLSPVVPQFPPVLEAKMPKMIMKLQFRKNRRRLLAEIMSMKPNLKSIRSSEPDYGNHSPTLDTREALDLHAPPPRNTLSALPSQNTPSRKKWRLIL